MEIIVIDYKYELLWDVGWEGWADYEDALFGGCEVEGLEEEGEVGEGGEVRDLMIF